MSRKAISIAFLVALSALVLVVAGCGSKKSSSSATTGGSAQTEASETTTDAMTDKTDTDSGSGAFSSEDCKAFAEAAQSASTKITGALSGTGGDIQEASKAFDELAAKAPDDIKGDFETFDEAFTKIADALDGVDLSGGKTPDPATIAKLSKLGTEFDAAKFSQAGANISAWVTANCKG